jgi:hypothetical protein
VQKPFSPDYVRPVSVADNLVAQANAASVCFYDRVRGKGLSCFLFSAETGFFVFLEQFL